MISHEKLQALGALCALGAIAIALLLIFAGGAPAPHGWFAGSQDAPKPWVMELP